MKLGDRISRFWLQLLVRRAVRKRDSAAAVDLLMRISGRFELTAVEEAELATMLLRSGNPAAAQRRFATLQKKMGSDPADRYIQKDCRYYLALMRDERSQAAYEGRLGQAIRPLPKFRKRLPMEPVAEKARPGVVATLTVDGGLPGPYVRSGMRDGV